MSELPYTPLPELDKARWEARNHAIDVARANVNEATSLLRGVSPLSPRFVSLQDALVQAQAALNDENRLREQTKIQPGYVLKTEPFPHLRALKDADKGEPWRTVAVRIMEEARRLYNRVPQGFLYDNTDRPRRKELVAHLARLLEDYRSLQADLSKLATDIEKELGPNASYPGHNGTNIPPKGF